MSENLDIFFSGLDAQEIVFHLEGGDRYVRGFFDNAFLDVNIGETALDTTQPRFTCKLSDVRDIPRETPVTIGTDSFSVLQIQPEGTGTATVTLAHE